MKKIQKKQLKEGTKPKDTESQEESENESKMSVKIKDENSSELWKEKKESNKKYLRETLKINSSFDLFLFVSLKIEYFLLFFVFLFWVLE